MLLPRREDSLHKSWLLRLLTSICDENLLASKLGFKGGTCAAMRGLLDRFSIDLDFDLLIDLKEMIIIREVFENIFIKLGLIIKDKSKKISQYFLKYPTKNPSQRNTIKLDASFPPPKANEYEMVHLPEIDRIVKCQTLETMFANKLVALISRYERFGKIAGRDIFDIHEFLLQGLLYKKEVILEQRQESLDVFLKKLVNLVETGVNSVVIDEDLNYLMPKDKFNSIRKTLKQETLMLLKGELDRVKSLKAL